MVAAAIHCSIGRTTPTSGCPAPSPPEAMRSRSYQNPVEAREHLPLFLKIDYLTASINITSCEQVLSNLSTEARRTYKQKYTTSCASVRFFQGRVSATISFEALLSANLSHSLHDINIDTFEVLDY